MYPRRGDPRDPIRNVKAHLDASKRLRKSTVRYVIFANLLIWAALMIWAVTQQGDSFMGFVLAFIISALSLGWYGLEVLGDYMTDAVADSRRAQAKARAEAARLRRAQRKRGETPAQMRVKVERLHQNLSVQDVQLGADGELILPEDGDSHTTQKH